MLAEKRQWRNTIEAGLSTETESGRDVVQITFDGLCGEIAFGALVGVCPDLGSDPRQGSSDFDLAGLTVDVKTTVGDFLNINRLKARTGRASDLYVAMVGPFVWEGAPEGVTFAYAGHMRHTDAFSPRYETINPYTHRPYQRIPLSRLEKDRDFIYSLSGG
jgi:hypothetical protein